MLRTIFSFLGMLALVFSLRFFVAEPFAIPSPSMYPTLIEGDYLYVSKFNYGYSRYNLHLFGLVKEVFPNAPKLFEGRIFAKQPKRGDVAVFLGEHDQVRYVKRVIGFPGEKIEFKKGIVYINDEPLPQERIEDYSERTILLNSKTPQYIETLPNGYRHKILRDDADGNEPADNMGPYYVPEGRYFMVGDNRNHSADSRYDTPVGFVPFENFLGPAQFIFFSIDSSFWDVWRIWEWPEIIRLKRFFTSIV